jgi:hypothetical protein
MHKQILTSLLLLILCLPVCADHAWNPSRRKGFEDLRKPIVIKLSPFHFFDRQLSLTSEFFSKSYRRSIAITTNIIYGDNSNVYDVGGSLLIERRFYPRGFNPDTTSMIRNSASGFYFSLAAQGGYSEFNDRQMNKNRWDEFTVIPVDYNVSITSMWVAPMVTVGYQLILWDALYLDAFVGGGVKINQTKKSSPFPGVDLSEYYQDSEIFTRYFKGIFPRVGISLGIGL